MKRPAGNETRIERAKRIFGETLAAMPKGVQTGLHRVRSSPRATIARDIEVVSPIGADSAASQSQNGAGLRSHRRDADRRCDHARRAGACARSRASSNSIVLVTDGIEECRGDPCAAAAGLKDLGIDVKVHVVGFALGAGESSKLQCVVNQTGGKYFDAKDAAALRRTLRGGARRSWRRRRRSRRPPVAAAPYRCHARQQADLRGQVRRQGPVRRELGGPEPQCRPLSSSKRASCCWSTRPRPASTSRTPSTSFALKDELAGRRLGHRRRGQAAVPDRLGQFPCRADDRREELSRRLDHYLGVRRSAARSSSSRQQDVGRRSDQRAEDFAGSGCGYGDSSNEEAKAIAKALENNGVRMVLQKRDRKYSGTFEIKDWLDAEQEAAQDHDRRADLAANSRPDRDAGRQARSEAAERDRGAHRPDPGAGLRVRIAMPAHRIISHWPGGAGRRRDRGRPRSRNRTCRSRPRRSAAPVPKFITTPQVAGRSADHSRPERHHAELPADRCRPERPSRRYRPRRSVSG